MINTSGFGVNVMPQLPAVDPSLLAFDPTKFTSGVSQGVGLSSQIEQLKAEQAKQAELAATREARINQLKALSQLDVLSAQKAAALQPTDIQANILKNEENIRQGQEAGATFGDRATLARLGTKLGTEQTTDKINNVVNDAELERHVRRSVASENEAHANYWNAEAEKNLAQAKIAGVKIPPETEAWLKNIGQNAADLGIPPGDLLNLATSNTLNERGESLRVEVSKFLQDIKKGDLAHNPFATTSYTLRAWLADSSPQAFRTIQQIGASAAAKAGQQPVPPGTPTIRIGPGGKIERIGQPGAEQPQPVHGPQTSSAPASTSPLMDAFMVAAPFVSNAKGLLNELRGNPILVKRLADFAPQGVAQTARAVAARSLAPASIAYGANELLGQAYNKNYLDGLQPVVGDKPANLSEGIALGMNQPSTESMAAQTRYDDVSHRIQSLIRAHKPDDPKVVGELTKLLDERNMLWSMISKD